MFARVSFEVLRMTIAMKRKGSGRLRKATAIPVRCNLAVASPSVSPSLCAVSSHQRGSPFIASEGPAIIADRAPTLASSGAFTLASGSGDGSRGLSLRQQAVDILSSARGRALALAEFTNNILKEGSRKAKESKLETLQIYSLPPLRLRCFLLIQMLSL